MFSTTITTIVRFIHLIQFEQEPVPPDRGPSVHRFSPIFFVPGQKCWPSWVFFDPSYSVVVLVRTVTVLFARSGLHSNFVRFCLSALSLPARLMIILQASWFSSASPYSGQWSGSRDLAPSATDCRW